VKSHNTYSLLVFFLWFGILLGRSAAYTTKNPNSSFQLFADVAVIAAGVMLGLDTLIFPTSSIVYRINKGHYSVQTIQLVGGLFAVANLVFGGFVVYRILQMLH